MHYFNDAISNHLSEKPEICLVLVVYGHGGGLAQWSASQITDQGVPGLRPGRVAIRCGLEKVIFTTCLVLVKLRKPLTYD